MLRTIFRAKKFRIKFNRYTGLYELQQSQRFGYKTIEWFEEREQAEQKLKLC